MIPFNKPFLVGKEIEYITEAVKSGKISGNGDFTKKCQNFFETKYGFKKCLLTTSCTDALEMAAILIDIREGDEVIMPSYTFVSTANAFVLRGAKIIFADSHINNPNIDASLLKGLVTSRTKAIVVVHYAGIACDMDAIISFSKLHNLFVIEDSAHAIDSYYKKKPLGGIGHLGTFSFHETKNIISGEGGMLAINDEKLIERAEVIWEKGTNRASFFRGEVNKYGWIDIGSSFLPSEITAAFLYAQLEHLKEIQAKRISIWDRYYSGLKALESDQDLQLPTIPEYATTNGHLFYLVVATLQCRENLLGFLRQNQIHAVFHYLPLHDSSYYKNRFGEVQLNRCQRFSDCLIRLPIYFELTDSDVTRISQTVSQFFQK